MPRRNIIRHTITAVALAVAYSIPSGAQQERSALPQAEFTSRVDVVQLDVLVLDKARRPVRRLTAEDFTVLEDGKPRPLVAFTPVDVPDVIAPAAPWMREIGADVTSNEIGARRFIVIVMDDDGMDLDPGVTDSAKRVAQGAIDQLGPEDLAAVVFTYRGRNQNFTSNRELLLAAVRSLVPHPRAIGCSLQPGGCQVETLSRIARVLKEAPAGRKTLIYISGGRRPFRGPSPDESNSANEDLLTRSPFLADMLMELQLANISVYAFDPHGLETLQPTAAVTGIPRVVQQMSPRPVANEALQSFAESTGGRAFTGMNRPWERVSEVFNENNAYYLLAFQASSPTADGRFRRIQVHVRGEGMEVRARSGYLAGKRPDREIAKIETTSRLDVAISRGLPTGELPLRVSVASFARPDRRDADVSVVFGMREMDQGDHLTVTGVAFDASWRMRGEFRETVAVRTVNRLGGKREYEGESTLRLRPGRYEVRLAAEHAGRVGSVFMDVDVPNFRRDAVSVSGLVFQRPQRAARDGSLIGSPPLTAAREFSHGDRIAAFVRVYQGDGPLASTRVSTRIINDRDETVFDRTTFLEIERFAVNRAVDHRIELPLERLAPGDYLLTIEAMKAKRTVVRTARFKIRND